MNEWKWHCSEFCIANSELSLCYFYSRLVRANILFRFFGCRRDAHPDYMYFICEHRMNFIPTSWLSSILRLRTSLFIIIIYICIWISSGACVADHKANTPSALAHWTNRHVHCRWVCTTKKWFRAKKITVPIWANRFDVGKNSTASIDGFSRLVVTFICCNMWMFRVHLTVWLCRLCLRHICYSNCMMQNSKFGYSNWFNHSTHTQIYICADVVIIRPETLTSNIAAAAARRPKTLFFCLSQLNYIDFWLFHVFSPYA